MAPTFRHGKGTYFAITSSTGGTINLSSGLDDSNLPRKVATAKVTVYGNNDENYIPGLRDATITASGHWSSTHEKKLTLLLGWSTLPSFTYGPETTAAGRRKFTGKCIVTDMEAKSPVSDKASISLTFQCSGAITSTNF